jgi:hypothetical protein
MRLIIRWQPPSQPLAVGDNSGSGIARRRSSSTPPAKIHGTGILNAFFMGMKADLLLAFMRKHKNGE